MEARAVRRICVLGVAVVALAGCGGGGKSDTTSSSATTTRHRHRGLEPRRAGPGRDSAGGDDQGRDERPFSAGRAIRAEWNHRDRLRSRTDERDRGGSWLEGGIPSHAIRKGAPEHRKRDCHRWGLVVTDTKGREKTVQFVTYLKPGEAFLTKPGGPRIAVPHDMCGHKIGAIEHTVEEEHIFEVADRCHPEGRAKITLTAFQHMEEEAVPALLDGQIELLYADAPALEYQQAEAWK